MNGSTHDDDFTNSSGIYSERYGQRFAGLFSDFYNNNRANGYYNDSKPTTAPVENYTEPKYYLGKFCSIISIIVSLIDLDGL